MAGKKQVVLSDDDTEGIMVVGYFNDVLADETDLVGRYFPIPTLNDLWPKMVDGVLLARFLSKVRPDIINLKALNLGLDTSGIRQKKGSPSLFKVTQNNNLVIEACTRLGCHMVNVGAEDLIFGSYPIVVGLMHQLYRFYLLRNVSVIKQPQLVLLLDKNESLQHLLSMPTERLLLRWFNYHLEASGTSRRLRNFAADLRDGECYLLLLKQIAAPMLDVAEIDRLLTLPKDVVSAKIQCILESAKKMGCLRFISERDILAGTQASNMSFTCLLFNNYMGINIPSEDILDDLNKKIASMTTEVAGLGKDSAAKTTELIAREKEKELKKQQERERVLDSQKQIRGEIEKKYEELNQKVAEKAAALEDLENKADADRLLLQQYEEDQKRQEDLIRELEADAEEERAAFDELLNINKMGIGKQEKLQEELAELKKKIRAAEEERSNMIVLQRQGQIESRLAAEMARLNSQMQETERNLAALMAPKPDKKPEIERSASEELLAPNSELAEVERRLRDLLPAEILETMTISKSNRDEVVMQRIEWLVEQIVRYFETLDKDIVKMDEQAKQTKFLSEIMKEKIFKIAEQLSKNKAGGICTTCQKKCSKCH